MTLAEIMTRIHAGGYDVERRNDIHRISLKERSARLQEERSKEREQTARVRADLEEAFGLQTLPKRDRLWEIAWSELHSCGYHEVAEFYGELANLFQ